MKSVKKNVKPKLIRLILKIKINHNKGYAKKRAENIEKIKNKTKQDK